MRATNEQSTLLTTQELAAYLKVPVSSLYFWRQTGKGPRAHVVGRHLRYKRSEVDRWIDAQT